MDCYRSNISDLPSLSAEITLGRLAKWLRLAGFDVLLDSAIPEAGRLLCKSRGPGRIILTRTRRVYKVLGPDISIFIRHNHIEAQLRQAMRSLSIQPHQLRPLTICATCNRRLAPALKDHLRQRVPDYIWHHCKTFFECPGCGKIYWPGTHADAMRVFMKRWFGEDG